MVRQQGEQQQRLAPSSAAQANISPPPQNVGNVIKEEQHTEYRDQYGNLLNEDEVSALEGQVSFSTHYETRTRLVDAAGNLIAEGPAGAGGVGGSVGTEAGVAPPHPDVQGRNPETAAASGASASASGSESASASGSVDDQPATVDAQVDLEKEESLQRERQSGRKPKPGSEGNQATKQK